MKPDPFIRLLLDFWSPFAGDYACHPAPVLQLGIGSVYDCIHLFLSDIPLYNLENTAIDQRALSKHLVHSWIVACCKWLVNAVENFGKITHLQVAVILIKH
jgi:hypothetical protein